MLVQSQAPSVFMHMLRHGVQPLKIAFPWLMFGFSGTLDVCEVLQRIASCTSSHITRRTSHVTRHTSHFTRHTSHQVLQLWDRVIAYDSLLPIPVLAAAVFVFRQMGNFVSPHRT
jgi:hypothetical protein